MTEMTPEADFETPRRLKDKWVKRILKRHGLPKDASIAEVKPKALNLWPSFAFRLDVVQMVMGESIPSDKCSDPKVAAVMMTDDPDRAFEELLSIKTEEEMPGENGARTSPLSTKPE